MSADAERRAIVEWIRSGAGPYVEGYGDEIADAIERGEHFAAQGIAAPSGGKTGTGLTVGKSPTPQGDAPNTGDRSMTNNVQTPGGSTTTAGAVEGLAMARRICAAHYRARARNPKNSYGHEMAHAERLINGDSDDWDCVQTTLAAITETSELAAKLAEDLINEMRGSGNNDLRTVRHRITVALHSGDHLKGPKP